MGTTCSRISETQCPGNHCDGLEKCFTCITSHFGDESPSESAGCYVASELLFLSIILPLIIFFAIIGVYILHRSRIKQSANINLCFKSMGGRQWSITIMYLLFEVAVLLDIHFWILAGTGAPDKTTDSIMLGIIFFGVAGGLICCSYFVPLCCSSEPAAAAAAPENMIAMGARASDPSVMSFHATPSSNSDFSGQTPTPVVPGYPVSGYYSTPAHHVAVGVGVGGGGGGGGGGAPTQVPHQVGQPATATPMSGGGVLFRYPMNDGVYMAAPVTIDVASSQVVHGSGDGYRPPAYSPPAASPTATSTAASTAASTAPIVKEDFRV